MSVYKSKSMFVFSVLPQHRDKEVESEIVAELVARELCHAAMPIQDQPKSIVGNCYVTGHGEYARVLEDDGDNCFITYIFNRYKKELPTTSSCSRSYYIERCHQITYDEFITAFDEYFTGIQKRIFVDGLVD